MAQGQQGRQGQQGQQSQQGGQSQQSQSGQGQQSQSGMGQAGQQGSQQGQAWQSGQQGQMSAAEVQQYTRGIDYPTGKQGVIEACRNNGAPQQVQDALKQLPDQQFGSAADLSKALGQIL